MIDREGWSFCHNSVDQTVPEEWYQKAEDDVARINKRFKDENADAVVKYKTDWRQGEIGDCVLTCS